MREQGGYIQIKITALLKGKDAKIAVDLERHAELPIPSSTTTLLLVRRVHLLK